MKALFLLTAFVLAPSFAFADDDDDDERRGRRHVYWEGPCKVERTWKKNGDYKEKRECKASRGPAHVVVSQPPLAVYPPWFGHHPVPPAARELPPRSAPERQPVYRCDAATGAAILGGILGGMAGNQIGGGSGKAIATAGGAIAGVLIGGEIGRRMDPHNEACIGQALEAAPAGGRLDWAARNNPNVHYVVVPGHIEQRGDAYCRSYTATIVTNGRQEQTRQMACRRPDGVWVRQI